MYLRSVEKGSSSTHFGLFAQVSVVYALIAQPEQQGTLGGVAHHLGSVGVDRSSWAVELTAMFSGEEGAVATG